MKTAHDALVELRALLAPDRWCQCAPAMDERGAPVTARDPSACQWCLVGGSLRVCLDPLDPTFNQSDRHLFREVQGVLSQSIKDTFPSWSYSSVELFNDAPERTYADILRVLDQAVAFTA